jgi:hypothetical protein
MKRKRFAPFSALIFFAVWLLLFVSGRDRLFRDPGTSFHTAAGERLLATGQLVHQDVYSFTCYGEPWIAQQWLGECIMAAIHRIAGLDGLLVATVSLIALLWSGLALRIERSGMHPALASLILAFSMAASSHHFHSTFAPTWSRFFSRPSSIPGSAMWKPEGRALHPCSS